MYDLTTSGHMIQSCDFSLVMLKLFVVVNLAAVIVNITPTSVIYFVINSIIISPY